MRGFLLLLSEPSGSPKFVEVKALNGTSILVRWSRVDEDSRNGIITRYAVHYEDVEKQNERTVDILAPATETIITGLRQKTKYSFKILAATSKGDGPYSNTTEEETEGNTFQSNLATYSKIVTFLTLGPNIIFLALQHTGIMGDDSCDDKSSPVIHNTT